jgi:hypothetical protein
MNKLSYGILCSISLSRALVLLDCFTIPIQFCMNHIQCQNVIALILHPTCEIYMDSTFRFYVTRSSVKQMNIYLLNKEQRIMMPFTSIIVT